MKNRILLSILIVACFWSARYVSGQGTAFTYQGQLNFSNRIITGPYSFTFSLYSTNTNGTVIAPVQTNNGVQVSNSLFSVLIDCGLNLTAGSTNWLEIGVTTNGGTTFNILTPRQPLTPTPFSVYAEHAAVLSGGTAIGVGVGNTIPSSGVQDSFIGGGSNNKVGSGASYSFIGGGRNNQASANDSLVAGGVGNSASGFASTVGGGSNNAASGFGATVPGGVGNTASGAYSLAAGQQAQATNQGSFVWADSQNSAFASNTNDQFSARAKGGIRFITGGAGMKVDGLSITGSATATQMGLALIPGGSFVMGNSSGDGDITDAGTNSVTVSAFYMDLNIVSMSAWHSVYLWATNNGYSFTHPGSSRSAREPVQTVDWFDAVKWCNARSQQAGLTPVYYTDAGFSQLYTNGEPTVYANWAYNGYRLPTEAEWEKAARSGMVSQRFPWGNSISQNLANYLGAPSYNNGNPSYTYDAGPAGFNASLTAAGVPYTTFVSYYTPNAYGLFDMCGNVYQWCWDWYGTPYSGGADPRGPSSGSNRILRGGSWKDYAQYLRTAYRSNNVPSTVINTIGFRCVRGAF